MAKEEMMIDDGLLAAFLDGNVSGKEVEAILQAAAHDSSLREFLAIAADVSDHASEVHSPLMALAAETPDKLCAIHCERYILRCFGISSSVEDLVAFAHDNDLIREEGTPLANIGYISEHYGLSVSRIFASDPAELEASLYAGRQVIAAVDLGELDPVCAEYESLEDRIVGPRPDHCVVVLSFDCDSDEVVCYDPSSGDIPVSIPVSSFLDAWKDSENYMVTVGRA